MELDKIVLTGKSDEQERIREVLTYDIPLKCIIPLNLNNELENEFYASKYMIDHGIGIRMVPRYKVRGVHLETEGINNIKNAPKNEEGREIGYDIWFAEDGFLIRNPMRISELRIHFK